MSIAYKNKFEVNLVIFSDIVNRVKSDATLEDMEKILKFYTKKIYEYNII